MYQGAGVGRTSGVRWESCPARNRTIGENAEEYGDSEMGWGDRWGTNDDLQAVIEAWPSLPEAVRADVVAIVKAATGGVC